MRLISSVFIVIAISSLSDYHQMTFGMAGRCPSFWEVVFEGYEALRQGRQPVAPTTSYRSYGRLVVVQ